MINNISLAINTLSFPGLGIGEFNVNEIAFSLFGHDVAWYGIIVTLAILSVCMYVYFRGVKLGYKVDDLLDYFIFSILFGIIGARLYYVLFYGLDRYIVTEGSFFHNLFASFMNIIGVWNGGIAIYGGIIGIVITVIVVSKSKKLPIGSMLDFGGHGAMLGQAIGRWGNFVNAEAHGGETDIFCRMGITNSLGITKYYHPTFLYESLWNIIGFVLISFLCRRQKYKGQAFIAYCAWYGFGRMIIEGLRTDSLYFGNTGIRVSQLLGFLLFAAGSVLLVVLGKKNKETTHEEFISSLRAEILSASVVTVKNNNGDTDTDDGTSDTNTKTETNTETETDK